MKRVILLDKEPRMDRKVFSFTGFSDFAFGISVVLSESCPATVSDSEAVFLCPGEAAHPTRPGLSTRTGRPAAQPYFASWLPRAVDNGTPAFSPAALAN